ncbi:hypothetical protein AB0E63_21860 [Kribbella sp. NPDC026596]|uniref:hypothetical protein n=1 Tax=Kribbella sp. NPDC026596 TaxID=3155122 RepID=UPI00340D2DE0
MNYASDLPPRQRRAALQVLPGSDFTGASTESASSAASPVPDTKASNRTDAAGGLAAIWHKVTSA